METIKTIEKVCESTRQSCIAKLRDLRVLIEIIERRVKDNAYLNDLGEIQGAANLVDCRLATLGALQQLLRKLQYQRNQASKGDKNDL